MVNIPLSTRVLYMLGVAGFLPSTVLPHDCDYKIKQQKFRMTNDPKKIVWVNFFIRKHTKILGDLKMGVFKNRGTPKWMVYNGKTY